MLTHAHHEDDERLKPYAFIRKTPLGVGLVVLDSRELKSSVYLPVAIRI